MPIKVVADNEVGLFARLHELARNVLAEKFARHWDASRLSHCRSTVGGFDTKARHAAGDKVLEQVTVIRSHFDNETVRTKAQLRGDHVDVRARMREPRGRHR